MSDQLQIRITVSDEIKILIEKNAKQYGMKPATYCFNLLFEQLRKEVKQN